MRPSDCVKFENSKKIKRGYLSGVNWWKSFLIVAPTCILFTGLIGILYLTNAGKLISWYLIPYILLFIFGTILLKKIKRHLIDKALTKDGDFLVCMASPIEENEGHITFIYTNGEKRHNTHFIKKLVEELPDDFFSDTDRKTSKRKQLEKYNNDYNCSIFIRTLFHNNIARRNPDWKDHDSFPVLYVNNKKVAIITKRDILELTEA